LLKLLGLPVLLTCLVGVVPIFLIPNSLPNLLFIVAAGIDLINASSKEFIKSLYVLLANVPMSLLSSLK